MHFDMAAILAAMSNRSMDQKTLQASMHLKKISRTTAVPYIVFQWAISPLSQNLWHAQHVLNGGRR